MSRLPVLGGAIPPQNGARAMGSYEVDTLLRSKRFQVWFRQHSALQSELDLLQREQEDAVEQYILAAGGHEDRATQAAADLESIEGSFEPLAIFEQQREAATEAWVAVQGLESDIENRSERASHLCATLGAGAVESDEWQRKAAKRLRNLKSESVLLGKELGGRRQQLAADIWTMTVRWREVSQAWLLARQASLAVVERRYLSRRALGLAEQVAQECRDGCEEQAMAVPGLRTELALQVERLESKLALSLERAQRLFSAMPGKRFLYWDKFDAPGMIYCVPLADEAGHLHQPVQALEIYETDERHGIDQLHKVLIAEDLADDHRLEQFFTGSLRSKQESSPRTRPTADKHAA